MADSFPLPPAGSPFSLTVTFTEEERPYLSEWYLGERLNPTETVEDFVRRLSVVRSLRFRKQNLTGDIRTEAEAIIDPALAAAEAELDTLQDDFETVKTQLGV